MPPHSPSGPVAFGPFVLDVGQASLLRDGQPVPLNGRPWALLVLLVSRAGHLVSKDELLDGVWGHKHVSESVLKVAVNALRAALGDDARAPQYVATVPRRGLRFVAACRAVDAAAAQPAPATPEAAADGLLGREADRQALRSALAQQGLVTLTGLPGVGKTRLALAVAYEDPPPDGVRVLRLDALDTPAALLPTLAELLQAGPAAMRDVAALGRALRGMHLRVVLDNAEHLAAAVAESLALLRTQAPQLQWLVTSQIPLGLPDEQVLPLAPLALAPTGTAQAPSPLSYAAGRLFVERVLQRDPQHVWQDGDAADIAALCAMLDGLPLALELAAARVPVLGVAALRRRLEAGLQVLSLGSRPGPARHRSLALALDGTLALLDDAARTAMQRLSLFAGSFSLQAAEAVLGPQALDLVQVLREHSLLVTEPAPASPPRLRLYDSVRRHARDALDASGGRRDVEDALLRWARAHFEQAEREEFETPLRTWLQRQRAEMPHLRLALGLALGGGEASAAQPADGAAAWRIEWGQRLAAASVPVWYRSGQGQEGWTWLQRAQRHPATAEVRTLLDHASGVLAQMGMIGKPETALQALQGSCAALQAAGDGRRAYLSMYLQFNLLLRLQQPVAASQRLLDQMAALEQPGWSALQRRYRLLARAVLAKYGDDPQACLDLAAMGAAGCRAAGGQAEAWVFDHLAAQVLAAQGLWAEAAERLAQVLAEVHAEGALREQLPLLAMTASVHLRDGGAPDALLLARQTVRLLQDQQMVWWMADALPWAAWHDGRAADALRLQAWADALVQARGDHRGPVFARMRQDLLDRCGLPPAEHALDEPSAIVLALGA